MLQLFPLLSSCSKLPAVPPPAVSLQVPWSPASKIFRCNSWHDNVAQRTPMRRKGKSCFTLRAKTASGTIQLAKVPWIASPSCRGRSHAQILNPRHCSSLARKLAQAGNNYAFNVWKRGGFSDRTKEVLQQYICRFREGKDLFALGYVSHRKSKLNIFLILPIR